MNQRKETALGEIPSDWNVLTVDEIKASPKKAIISGPFGSNISSKYFVASGIPVIRGNNLSLQIGKKFIDDGFVYLTDDKANELGTWAERDDLIFTAAGTIGQVGILLGNEKYSKYIISNKQLRVRLNKNIVLPTFAYYWFNTPFMRDTIMQRDTGSTIPLINLSVLKGLPIPVPELPEQTAIATILSSLDDKIDLLYRQNQTLEALAETLFRQWFVEDTDDWPIKKVSEIIEVRDGTHDSPKQKEEGKFLITSKHLKPTGIDFYSAYKISDEDFEAINKRSKVDKGDILFSMIGTLGLIFFVSEPPVYAVKNIGLFKSSQKPWFGRFLFMLLKSPLGKNFIYENASGSTQEYITLGSLRNFEFPFHGEDKIKEFDETVGPLFLKVESNNNQIRTLTQLRDNLLPKLMSGEVRVKM